MDENQSFTWFVGLFEGEGSFYFSNGRPKRLTISMTDLDVLERVRAVVGGVIYQLPARKLNWKPAWLWYLGGAESRSLATKMLPLLGERRAVRCQEYITLHRSQREYHDSRKERSEELAQRVLEMRSTGLTHQKIADRVGVDRSHVSKILKTQNMVSEAE